MQRNALSQLAVVTVSLPRVLLTLFALVAVLVAPAVADARHRCGHRGAVCSTPPAPPTTAVNTTQTSVAPGEQLTVNWTAPEASSATDWISVFEVSVSNDQYGDWKYTNGEASGPMTLTAPDTAGDYELRYLLNDGYESTAKSATITVTATPAPTAETETPAPTAEKATTRPVGSVILSDADAASRVKRSSFEPRAGNATANQKVPTSAELGRFRTYSPDWGECAEKFKPYITGNFTGTTDEQIQRVAHKWGIDEDIVRAVAVKESYWNQDARGDWDPNTQDYMSYGLTQVRRNSRGESAPNWDGTFPLSRDSTAFNLDFWAASVRQYYEGCSTWLNDLGVSYAPGDMWGSVGAWYAGRWYNADAQWYIGEVKTILNNRTWKQTGF